MVVEVIGSLIAQDRADGHEEQKIGKQVVQLLVANEVRMHPVVRKDEECVLLRADDQEGQKAHPPYLTERQQRESGHDERVATQQREGRPPRSPCGPTSEARITR